MAAYPADAVRDELLRLDRAPTPGVRWTPPEQWHVTLRFLGDADEEAAAEALARVDHPGVDALLGPTVTLLGESVVIAPVAGLEPLASMVSAAMETIAESASDHGFVGHLTLGRLGAGATCELLETPVSGRWRCTGIALVRSIRDGGRVRHETLVTRRLAQSS